jgi:hypothetical protein
LREKVNPNQNPNGRAHLVALEIPTAGCLDVFYRSYSIHDIQFLAHCPTMDRYDVLDCSTLRSLPFFDGASGGIVVGVGATGM